MTVNQDEALDNWLEEKRSAYLYRAIAQLESYPPHQKLFLELALRADSQAALWEEKLQDKSKAKADYSPDLRTRCVIWLVKQFGARALRRVLAAMKVRGMAIYLGGEIGHTVPTPDEMEHRHRSISRGNNIRAAIFGVNDGLISNTSLILGMVGASASANIIFLTGVAGLLAGACSMGAGEYVSVRSQREMLEYQLNLEKKELELYPEEEAMELALIYEARGLSKEEANKVAHLLIQNPEKALETLAREELGIDPGDLVSPTGAAVSSFISFAIGAFLPLLPFIFSQSKWNVFIMIAVTAIALFVVGALMSLFTQKNAWWSGLRMMLIGGGAGIFTYLIGGLLGVD